MFPLISAIVLRRLLLAIPTLLLLSLVVFVVLRMLPVDPLVLLLPASATAADAAVLREQLGFDKPVPQQFLIWLWQAFNGNLGTSIFLQRPVTQALWERAEPT
ncbi:ABC transporter permease, partial [Verminephrobacter sp. Larva24]